MSFTHYEVLEVAETATQVEIKRAYRRLAKKYHPDRNKKKGAEEKFKEINLAHQVLGDASRRQSYDEDLHQSRKAAAASASATGSAPPPPPPRGFSSRTGARAASPPPTTGAQATPPPPASGPSRYFFFFRGVLVGGVAVGVSLVLILFFYVACHVSPAKPVANPIPPRPASEERLEEDVSTIPGTPAPSPVLLLTPEPTPVVPVTPESSPDPLEEQPAGAPLELICTDAMNDHPPTISGGKVATTDPSDRERSEDESPSSPPDTPERDRTRHESSCRCPDTSVRDRSDDDSRDESWRLRHEPSKRHRAADRWRRWYEIPERDSVRERWRGWFPIPRPDTAHERWRVWVPIPERNHPRDESWRLRPKRRLRGTFR